MMRNLIILIGLLYSFGVQAAEIENFDQLALSLFSEKEWRNQPQETSRSLSVHFQDSYKKFPHLEEIRAANLKPPQRIEGKMTYVGFVPKGYRYDYKIEDGRVIIGVRIHLSNPSEEDLTFFKNELKNAEGVWNSYRIPMDFSYQFRFEIVPDRKAAHYSVKIKNTTRGPYDVAWSRSWDYVSIAHEVGHMMGLGDEYQTLTGKINCRQSSLMCFHGPPWRHHYYFILRRLIR